MTDGVDRIVSKQIYIIGNPNVGKTMLFNDLTDANEKMANLCGITMGITPDVFFDSYGIRHKAFDFPGTYGLSAYAPEEREVCSALFDATDDIRILYALDAEHLERNLFLGTQILELGLPTCFAITLSEQACNRGHFIDIPRLEQALGVPVVLISERLRQRKQQLKDIVTLDKFKVNTSFHVDLPEKVANIVKSLSSETDISSVWCSILLFQGTTQREVITKDKEKLFVNACKTIDEIDPDWKLKYIESRYQKIEKLLENVIESNPCEDKTNWDNLFLHKFWGPISIFIIFSGLLMSVFTISEYPIRWCEILIQTLQSFLHNYLPDNWFRGMLCEGIIGGVGNVLLFLPQFILMIACMSLLENTGYLARVTFLLDRWMKKIGLSGSSFIALISCYACTIPGIMQTRCLHNREERLTTLFVAPWVNCSSRVPIYMLLITMLFRDSHPWFKTFLLIIIYIVGLFSALMLAAFIRKFFLKTRNHVHVAEMPPLLRPQFHYIFKLVQSQTVIFLKKAGTYILCFSIGLWLCLHTKITTSQGEQTDCVRWLGKKLEYVLKPIGFDWHIGISLLSSFGTRENFISTLGVLHNTDAPTDNTLREQLQQATDDSGHPIYSFATCISLILFFMFSLQCIGTFVFIKHETYSWRLTWLQFIFMNTFAYSLCFVVYQILKRL